MLYYMDDFVTGEAQDLIASIPKRYTGLAARATYSFKDTYFIEGNLGYTGSEAFEKARSLVYFPLSQEAGCRLSTNGYKTT